MIDVEFLLKFSDVKNKRLCNKAILLEHGQLIAQGDIDEVADIYEKKLEE